MKDNTTLNYKTHAGSHSTSNSLDKKSQEEKFSYQDL